MGQYRQWLYHRELEMKLHEQLTQLETELTQLQKQAPPVQEDPSECIHNPILQALALHRSYIEGQAASVIDASASAETFSSHDTVSTEQSAEAISAALLAWGDLPYFHTGPVQDWQHELHGVSHTLPATPQSRNDQPPASHPELSLLPEDMVAFFDEHGRTEPQLELPWWLRNIISTSRSNTTQNDGPVDQESQRTNRLIQRWSERWGRQIPTTPRAEEEEHDAG